MSVGFEALPRQRGCAKWLVLLPCVFVPVYLCALVAGVCTHVCISVCVCSPLSSLCRRMHTLADYGSVHACVKRIQNLVLKRIIIKEEALFSPPFGHKWKKNVKNETKQTTKKKHLLSHTKWNFYIGWVGRNQEDTQKDNIWTVPRAQIKWTQIGPCFPSSWDVTVKYTVNVTEKHYHPIS